MTSAQMKIPSIPLINRRKKHELAYEARPISNRSTRHELDALNEARPIISCGCACK